MSKTPVADAIYDVLVKEGWGGLEANRIAEDTVSRFMASGKDRCILDTAKTTLAFGKNGTNPKSKSVLHLFVQP